VRGDCLADAGLAEWCDPIFAAALLEEEEIKTDFLCIAAACAIPLSGRKSIQKQISLKTFIWKDPLFSQWPYP
jgi:hypothetical protein